MFAEYLPIFMFAALGVLLFTGFPVAFILGGVGLAFAFIGILMGEFQFIFLKLLPSRIFGGVMENPFLSFLLTVVFALVASYRIVVSRALAAALMQGARSASNVGAAFVGAAIFLSVFTFIGGTDLWLETGLALGLSPLQLVQTGPDAVVHLSLLALFLWQAFKSLRADWRAV